MNFGSKYVWDSDGNESAEEIDHEELREEEAIPSLSSSDSNDGDAGEAGPSAPSKKKKVGFLSRLFSSSGKKKKEKKNRRSNSRSERRSSLEAEAGSSIAAGSSALPPRPPPFPQKVHRVRKADCNVLAICMDSLATEDALVFTGEPIFCEGCQAVLSAESRVIWANPDDPATSDATWACEFCAHINEAMALHPEEVPKGEAVDYILEPSPISERSNTTESNVVFTVDISGSMCVTTPFSGKLQLTDSQKRQREKLSAFNDDNSQQFLPGESRHTTYISRLQCMQSAVTTQIDALAKEHPESRVAIVSFSNEVNVNGVEVIAGDKLQDYEKIKDVGANHKLDRNVGSMSATLTKRVQDLEEGGQTALGPALLSSIALAASTPGSKVILCTDGLANVGLGSLEDEDPEEARTFYRAIGEYAREHDVAVSIVTIKGTQCSVEDVGAVPELTGGDIEIVDPEDLGKNFNDILNNPTIATKCQVKVLLHKGLKFRNQAQEATTGQDEGMDTDETLPSAVHVVTTELGNVTAETTQTYEFEKNRRPDAPSLEGLRDLPFQSQIFFTRRDGTRCLRVVTRKQEITADRNKVEDELDVAVLGANTMQQSARLAAEGNYAKAKLKQVKNARLIEHTLKRKKALGPTSESFEAQQQQYTKFKSHTTTWGNQLAQTVREEEEDGEVFDDSDSSGSFGRIRAKTSSTHQKRSKARKSRRSKNDELANARYQASKASYGLFM